MAALEETGGRASIAFKAPESGRTISGADGMTRKEAVSASAAREALQLLERRGVQVELYSSKLAIAHVVIDPRLGADLARSPHVDWVEPTFTGEDQLAGVRAARRAPQAGETRPWGVDTVRAPSAWSRADGSGVAVMIIDSGHDQGHEDLPDVADANCDWGIGNGGCVDDAPAGFGWWHGTGVIGTLAAVDNSIGLIGVAPGIDADDIYFWQRCQSGTCTFSGQLSEPLDSAGAWGVDVVNMSFTYPNYNASDASAISNARANDDIVLVAALGNTGTSVANYPAAYSGVVAVSGINDDKSFADPSTGDGCGLDSSWGVIVDLSAPFDVFTTAEGDDYAYTCGTSFAAPHVTGVVAMIREYLPSLSEFQTRLRLFDTSRDWVPTGGTTSSAMG